MESKAAEGRPEDSGLGSRIHQRFAGLEPPEVPRAGDTPRAASLGESPQQRHAMEATTRAWAEMSAEFGLLSATEVAAVTGASPSVSVESATTGHSLIVTVDEEPRWPGFQFSLDGTVNEIIPELVALADARGWSQEGLALWLCTRTGWLAGDSRPVDVLRTDPHAVLEAARKYLEDRW